MGVFMAEAVCPICSADVPLDGDEKTGQTIYCAYCSSSLRVARSISDDTVNLLDDN